MQPRFPSYQSQSSHHETDKMSQTIGNNIKRFFTAKSFLTVSTELPKSLDHLKQSDHASGGIFLMVWLKEHKLLQDIIHFFLLRTQDSILSALSSITERDHNRTATCSL